MCTILTQYIATTCWTSIVCVHTSLSLDNYCKLNLTSRQNQQVPTDLKLLHQFAEHRTIHKRRCRRQMLWVGVGRRGYISPAKRASLNNLYMRIIHSYLHDRWTSSSLGTCSDNEKQWTLPWVFSQPTPNAQAGHTVLHAYLNRTYDKISTANKLYFLLSTRVPQHNYYY